MLSELRTDPAYAKFIAAIAADFDNDDPRLVFADWLADRGEGERAELIRVQCELGHIHPRDGSQHLKTVGHVRQCKRCQLEAIEDRLHDSDAEVDWRFAANHANSLEWCRGFVHQLRIKSHTWAEHGDDILLDHPVVKVDLTTPLTADELPWDFNDVRRSIRSRIFCITYDPRSVPFTADQIRNLQVTCKVHDPCVPSWLESILRLCWPSVREWSYPRRQGESAGGFIDEPLLMTEQVPTGSFSHSTWMQQLRTQTPIIMPPFRSGDGPHD